MVIYDLFFSRKSETKLMGFNLKHVRLNWTQPGKGTSSIATLLIRGIGTSYMKDLTLFFQVFWSLGKSEEDVPI